MLRRHDGLVALGLEEIPPFLTRSAFAGSQRYGAILWSGDIESTFDELAVQVQVAQHVAMSGIYLWCAFSDSFGLQSFGLRGAEMLCAGQLISAALEMATQRTQPSVS